MFEYISFLVLMVDSSPTKSKIWKEPYRKVNKWWDTLTFPQKKQVYVFFNRNKTLSEINLNLWWIKKTYKEKKDLYYKFIESIKFYEQKC